MRHVAQTHYCCTARTVDRGTRGVSLVGAPRSERESGGLKKNPCLLSPKNTQFGCYPPESLSKIQIQDPVNEGMKDVYQ